MMKSAATVIPSPKKKKKNKNFPSQIKKPIDWFTLRKKNKYKNT